VNEYGDDGVILHFGQLGNQFLSAISGGDSIHDTKYWDTPYSGPPAEGWDIASKEWRNDDRDVGALFCEISRACRSERKPRTFTLTVPRWVKTTEYCKTTLICNSDCIFYDADDTDQCVLGFSNKYYPDPAKCPGSSDHDVEIECTVKE